MIYSLVTLYCPGNDVVNNIKSISSQSDKVFVCDNSPVNNGTIFAKIENVEYVFFDKNNGLSVAFNTILKNRSFSNSDYVIFFDQDSYIEKNHISSLIEEYELLEKNFGPIGCVGPVYLNSRNNKIEIPIGKTTLTSHSYKVKSVITSSMLCKFENLKKINFWNENIFLDMADWDLCWRLQKANMPCCMTDVSVLYHTLGEKKHNYYIFKVQEWTPLRTYYQIRDSMSLMRENYVPLKFKIRFIFNLTIRPVIYLLFLDKKKSRLHYYYDGIRDFFKGKNGSY